MNVYTQSIISFVISLVVTIFGFLSTIVFTRVLGADLLGVYYLFLAYFSIFNVFSEFGLGNGLIKKISEGDQQLNYLSSYFVLRLLFLSVTTVLMACLIPDTWLFFGVFVALCLSFCSSTITYWILGNNKFSIYNLSKAIGELVKIIFSIILVLLGFSVGGIIGAFCIGLCVTGLICLKDFKIALVKPDIEHLMDLLKFSACIAVVNIVAILMGYSDVLTLNIFGNTEDIGIYRVILQFASVLLLAANAYNTIIYPKLSFYAKRNQDVDFNKLVNNSISCSLVVGVPCCIGGILVSEPAIFYLYGADFACSSNVFCVLLIYHLVMIFSLLYSTALSAKNQVFVLFKINLMILILNLVLNVLLFYFLGIMGIAFSSLTCVIVQTIMEKRILGKMCMNNIFLLKIVVSSIIMCFFLIILGDITSLTELLLHVGIGVCVYFIVLLLIGKEMFILLKT